MMTEDQGEDTNNPGRRSIRLKGYDYSLDGAYFITICTWNRECLFGDIVGATGGSPNTFNEFSLTNDKMVLNEFGEIVRGEWLRTPEIRKEIVLDEYIVMPNHFHGIVYIKQNTSGNCDINSGDRKIYPGDQNFDSGDQNFYPGDQPVAPTRGANGPKTRSIGALIAGYKSIVTKRINEIRHSSGNPVWQRNYYDRIIRNYNELNDIRHYIMTNPENWQRDRNNPNYNS